MMGFKAAMDEVGLAIRALLSRQERSQQWLARQMDADRSTVSRLLAKGSNPTIGTVWKALNALGASWHDLADELGGAAGEARPGEGEVSSRLESIEEMLGDLLTRLPVPEHEAPDTVGAHWNAGARALMEEKGLDPAQVAERAGLARSVLADLFAGRQAWNVYQMERFVRALSVSVDEVFARGREAEPHSHEAEALLVALRRLPPQERALVLTGVQRDRSEGDGTA